MSITGLAPLTVIVSSIPPTCNWASTVAVKPLVNAIPSRTNVLNPGSTNERL
jgi:hypothetical protein